MAPAWPGHPVDREQQRGDRVDDEAEVVDLHPAEHVAEPAEADDQDAGDDQVAEDHPEQVEAVRGHQRIEVDAAEDVRHRDQRDRGVERRQQDRQGRVGERDPLVAVAASQRDHYTQANCAVSLSHPGAIVAPMDDQVRRRPAGQRAAGRARPADPPAARRAPLPALPGRRARPPRPRGPAGVSDLAVAERVRPQSMAQTVGDLEADGLVERAPGPQRRPPRPGQPDRGRAGRARSKPTAAAARAGWSRRSKSCTPEERRRSSDSVSLLRRLADVRGLSGRWSRSRRSPRADSARPSTSSGLGQGDRDDDELGDAVAGRDPEGLGRVVVEQQHAAARRGSRSRSGRGC